MAQNFLTKCEAGFQQPQTRNHETTLKSNAYQARIATFHNELNNESANVEAQRTAAVAGRSAPEQQLYIKEASSADIAKFNHCGNNL
jgi:hypothetical protein